ncbi:MAG: hypothetical protein GX359_08905 [Clostridiales bacterium]|nr:hypothetical protein [Clostridiales bacterium]
MKINIQNLCNNIRKGKLLEENIPTFFNLIADHYNRYAGINLAMHYHTFYEFYLEDSKNWSKEAKSITLKINKIIRDNVLQEGKNDRIEIIRKVDELRKEIMKRMNCLSVYIDIFKIYEYVLNRTEYRFKPEEVIDIANDEFARELLQYIFNTEDNVVINAKLMEIVGQLPVRMTKQKYFDVVKESLNNYIGADKSSLDTYIYMLRTTAMLHSEEGMAADYPKLWEYKDMLSKFKFKNISFEEYRSAEQILKDATSFLNTESSVYYSLQEIINGIYAILLTSTYLVTENTETISSKETVNAILNEVNRLFLSKEKANPAEELELKFESLEGIQEEHFYEAMIMDDTLDEIDINQRKLVESLAMEPFLNTLIRTKKLLSDSLFIDLDEIVSDSKVGESHIRLAATKLQEEMAVLFARHDRLVVRAVMANTLSHIPVFFNNHTEVMNYVRYSLDRCNDPYEKTACIEILKGIMIE